MTLRLRRIRYKDGRTVEVYHNKEPNEIGKVLLRHAAILAREPTLSGFAVVSWGPDHFGGWRNQGWRIGRDSPIGETMMPSFVKDVLMRSVCDPREDE